MENEKIVSSEIGCTYAHQCKIYSLEKYHTFRPHPNRGMFSSDAVIAKIKTSNGKYKFVCQVQEELKRTEFLTEEKKEILETMCIPLIQLNREG